MYSAKPTDRPRRCGARDLVLGLVLCQVIVMTAADSGNAAKPEPPENLALLATITGPGKTPEAVADGVKQRDGHGEWVSDSTNAWFGRINYPTLHLAWDTPRTINKVVVYDRPVEAEHMAGCILKFSDNSRVDVSAVPNDGSPKTVVFEPRTVTGMTVAVADGVGWHIGLSELEVHYDPEATPDSLLPKEFTDFVSYVDPTIETGRGRWFFCAPGSRPFGMVSAAAYTRNKNQGGGGYNYNSTEIRGFAQIHAWIMSGVNIIPTTGAVNPNKGEAEWKSPFSHETEIIEPGYHRVFLDRYKTRVEYTATDHLAFYRLNYQEAARANLLVQLGGFVGAVSCVDGRARLVSKTRIEGSHGMTDRLWGGPKLSHVYFVLDVDRPILRMDGWKGADETLPDIRDFANPVSEQRLEEDKRKYLFKNLPEEQAGVSLAYDVAPGDTVQIRIGISFTSIENARRNLDAECNHWDFDRVRKESRDEWNRWLGRIAVEGGRPEARVKFYTDLWHVLLGRHRIDDVNGDYPNFMSDEPVKTVPLDASGKPLFHMYNFDALWLTMWNLNILWGLGWPEVLDDFTACLVRYAEVGGHLPRGPSAGGYTGIMVGCPAISMITAAWQKGLLKKAVPEKAYEFMKSSIAEIFRGDLSRPGVLVQTAFEYWALSQMAREMNKEEDIPSFQEWTGRWKGGYNPEQKLIMARTGTDGGDWLTTDPLAGNGWVEGNSWHGTFSVVHDIKGLAELMGGPDELARQLNYGFEQSAPGHFHEDNRSGCINYSNQPGCGAAHVFNHAGFPWLSQYWVRRVSREAYGAITANRGYAGYDEDQGQMGGVSALMKIGLFSLRGTCAEDPIYEITAPEFDEITITLNPDYYPGKTFTISTHGNAEEHCYIQKAELNGVLLENCWFRHEDFAAGGTLDIWVGPEPNKAWGKSPIQFEPESSRTEDAE